MSGDLFIGMFDIVFTTKTKADLSDVNTATLEVKKPDTNLCAAIQEDESIVTFTDYLREASDDLVDDVPLLPVGALTIGDAFYIGFPGRFPGVDFVIKNAGVGSWGLTWEYPNPTWTALAGVVDGTGDFQNNGKVNLEFTMPTDWEQIVVGTEGVFYWIRGRVTTADATPTTQPFANRISIRRDSLTGSITTPGAVSGDADFGKFTSTIPDGTFDVPGLYTFRAKLVTPTGVFYGKSIGHEVKDEFA